MNGYLSGMRSYAVFYGRTSRQQFWQFITVTFVLGIATAIADENLDPAGGSPGVLTTIVSLVHLLPSFGIMVRRLHDLDRTGWWALLGLTVVGWLLLLFKANPNGSPGTNRFGPPPGDPAAADPGAATASGALPATATLLQRDPIAEIERLAQLRASGSLSEVEFEVMKAGILSQSRAGA